MMNIVTLAVLADIADIREHMPGFLEVTVVCEVLNVMGGC